MSDLPAMPVLRFHMRGRCSVRKRKSSFDLFSRFSARRHNHAYLAEEQGLIRTTIHTQTVLVQRRIQMQTPHAKGSAHD